MLEIKDEILNGDPVYTIKNSSGTILYENCSIELVTQIIQQGTPLNKELFDKIQGIVDYMNNKNYGEVFLRYNLENEVDDIKYSKTESDVV